MDQLSDRLKISTQGIDMFEERIHIERGPNPENKNRQVQIPFKSMKYKGLTVSSEPVI